MVILLTGEKDYTKKKDIICLINYLVSYGRPRQRSIEEKAAHLLYFTVKNHSFVDGNKRIAAAIFTWFLERNGLLYKSDGTKRLADNALVALTLMIAMSDP
ncbi:MAG: Fic family protein, partial [Deltaproteobacteria bacterium]|nr:Fic family protein [Deltaproteobacteria bacterium]